MHASVCQVPVSCSPVSVLPSLLPHGSSYCSVLNRTILPVKRQCLGCKVTTACLTAGLSLSGLPSSVSSGGTCSRIGSLSAAACLARLGSATCPTPSSCRVLSPPLMTVYSCPYCRHVPTCSHVGVAEGVEGQCFNSSLPGNS